MKKKIYFKKIMLITMLFSVGFILNCTAQVTESIKSSFNQYKRQTLHEKVFIHTDKTFYLAGEILWFKAYTVDATLNKPLDISKVCYVEVLDNHNNPVLQTKILLKTGIGNGSLYLPVTAVNGNYKLRAYTSWMKNFSADFYFEQPIAIINPLVPPPPLEKVTKPDNDIRFFPEGGNLVDGLKSTVAFKAVGPDGRGIDIMGVVVNQHNDTVAHFKSFKYGMGHFAFTPSANDTYKAVMRIGQNNALIKDLPAVNKQGYVLQLNDADAAQLSLTISTKIPDQQNSPIYVFVHSGQYVNVAEALTLNNGTARLAIDKSKLGDGIVHITLFNGQKTPVCERLYFKRPKQLNISATADQFSYHLRKKVNIDISTINTAGKPQMADLSLSVYKMDSLETAEPPQILSYLWLTSEIKGNIESADYYLKNNNAESNEALDNLLMTQGWSRFKWADVLNPTPPAFKFLPEYTGHIITGKVTLNETGKPVESMIAHLGATGKRVQVYSALSDADGRLLFNTRDFYGASEIVLQLNFEKDSLYHLEIQSPFSEQYTAAALPGPAINGTLKTALETHSIATQAQNIFTAGKLKQYYNPGVDSTAFFGKGKTYLLDDFTRFTTMEEVLREYISEVNVVRSQKHFHIKILNEQGFLNDDPLVILDGIPIFNMDRVMAIDPLKVKKLEDINHWFYWGPSSYQGILSFTTYKGDLGGFEINPHAVVLDYEGMQLQREFYSPVYDTDDKVKSRLPDFRNLLYWSPEVSTNAQGKTQASFYTADEAGKYIGIVQGITANGEAGSRFFTFYVEK